MRTRRKPQPLLVRQATAYRRLAAKAMRAGDYRQAEHYGRVADSKMRQHNRMSGTR